LAVALAALSAPAAAQAKGGVAVIVRPASAPVFSDPDAAHGLLIAGEGATVSRRTALASLLTGETANSVVNGGRPGGKPKITLSQMPAAVTFYLALPAPGRHHNVVRYPIAVIGPGYHGLLTSTSTHLTGLVPISDVAPSVLALQRGEQPRIRSRASADPLAYLRDFDRRMTAAHDARTGALLVFVGLIVGLGLLAVGTRSRVLARAAFLTGPACLVVSLLLSALDVTRPAHVYLGLALGAGALALGGGALLPPRLPLALGLAALFVFLFAALWAEPRWNSLAVLGARPDGGGRFYGINNQMAALLLSPALVLGALTGPQALPGVALVVSAGVGVSTIGANGGGLLAFLAAFIALGLLLRETRPTPLRVAVAIAVVVAAALALVGIDAALGGSNHVTHAVGGGPGSLAGHFAHRLHLAAAFVAMHWNQAFLFAISVAGLIWVGLLRPRIAVLDALLVGIVVLLLVSDNPTDIVGLGSLTALVLRAWLGRTGERLDGLD
jgi:hypothetical protein